MRPTYSIILQCILLGKILNSTHGEPLAGKQVISCDPMRNEFPFIVSLHITDERYPHLPGKHFCGGTLISTNHILTAQHCIGAKDYFKKNVEFLVGSSDLRCNNVQRFKAAKVWKFEKWPGRKKIDTNPGFSDIAVVKLKGETRIKPALLPWPRNTFLAPSDLVIMAGWGMTSDGSHPMVLKKAYLRIMSKTDCMTRIDHLKPGLIANLYHNSAVCSTADPAVLGLCGDSGTPILQPVLDDRKQTKYHVVGIHSGICPKMEMPHRLQINLSMNVTYFRSFITYAMTSP